MMSQSTLSLKLCATFLVLILPLAAIAEETASITWQVILSYDSQSVTFTEATPMPAMQKQVRSLGLTGAPIRIVYQLQWLDNNGQTLKTTVARLPLGIRGIPAESEVCREFMPPSGKILIRVEGSDEKQAPAAVRFERVLSKGGPKGDCNCRFRLSRTDLNCHLSLLPAR